MKILTNFLNLYSKHHISYLFVFNIICFQIKTADILSEIKKQELQELEYGLNQSLNKLAQIKNKYLQSQSSSQIANMLESYEEDPDYQIAKDELNQANFLMNLSKSNVRPILQKYLEILSMRQQQTKSLQENLPQVSASQVLQTPYRSRKLIQTAALMEYDRIINSAKIEYDRAIGQKPELTDFYSNQYKQFVAQAKRKYIEPFGSEYFVKKADGTKQFIVKPPIFDEINKLAQEFSMD